MLHLLILTENPNTDRYIIEKADIREINAVNKLGQVINLISLIKQIQNLYIQYNIRLPYRKDVIGNAGCRAHADIIFIT